MKPKTINHRQGHLFETRLSNQLNPDHPLVVLAKKIDWASLEQEISPLFKEHGRPGKPVRLIVGLMMLQHMFGFSDEMTVMKWVENPYWQLFCGYDYLQWEFPINPSSLVHWRRRLGEKGLQKVLYQTVQTGLKTNTICPSSLKQVIVDTTVMEKNITYPTDAKLFNQARRVLVRMCKSCEIELRQNYNRVSRKVLCLVGRYAHARQMRRCRKQIKKLKIYLGRVVRDVKRRIRDNRELEFLFSEILEISDRLLKQERDSSNKIYSVHHPEVECISKGKVHKKYEFGCKVSLVTTHREGFVLQAKALHGNPYDGHTLNDALKESEAISDHQIIRVFVDKGYRGHGLEQERVFVSGQKKGMTNYFKKLIRRRQAIEPHIGHMKSEGKLDRNYLAGRFGDEINAILVGIGHNLRLIAAKIRPKFLHPRTCFY